MEELEEELTAVTNCTTLTLVDAAPSQSASLRDAARTLLVENQDYGVGCQSPAKILCQFLKNKLFLPFNIISSYI
ncbi:MAG: hypothetical protein KME55_38140 [Nostoc indistinguendum CM1-VF10]|jgi:hypothetical protein|nr:hypothetical protein [Nostoc indistinguendum CM1-VF10]